VKQERQHFQQRKLPFEPGRTSSWTTTTINTSVWCGFKKHFLGFPLLSSGLFFFICNWLKWKTWVEKYLPRSRLWKASVRSAPCAWSLQSFSSTRRQSYSPWPRWRASTSSVLSSKTDPLCWRVWPLKPNHCRCSRPLAHTNPESASFFYFQHNFRSNK